MSQSRIRSHQCQYYQSSLCPRNSTVVPASGNPKSDLIIIGEAPGETENEKGIPFCGDSGAMLNQLYLPYANRKREQVLVTNVVKCMPDLQRGARTPSQELIDHCASCYLDQELASSPATVAIALGKIAAHRLGLTGSMDDLCAVPHWSSEHAMWIVPSYHPAAAMRSEGRISKIMLSIMLSFSVAGEILRTGTAPIDDIEARYRKVESESEIETAPVMAVDTETAEDQVVVMSWATAPGVAFCTWNRDVMRAVLQRASVLVFHNAPYDVDYLNRSGIEIPDHVQIHDTMLAAYSLRTLPLGLKPLSRILLGMEMHDYDEAIRPHIMQSLAEWARREQTRLEFEFPMVIPNREYGTEMEILVRGRSETLSHYRKRIADHIADIWSAYEQHAPQWVIHSEDEKQDRALKEVQKLLLDCSPVMEIHKKLGKLIRLAESGSDSAFTLASEFTGAPHPDIRCCSPDAVIRYACRDADATLRLWSVLSKEVNMRTDEENQK